MHLRVHVLLMTIGYFCADNRKLWLLSNIQDYFILMPSSALLELPH